MTIDYEAMRREHPKNKAALTRAINSGDPEKILAACRKAVASWERWGAWPDDWSRWQRALDDTFAWGAVDARYWAPDLEDLS